MQNCMRVNSGNIAINNLLGWAMVSLLSLRQNAEKLGRSSGDPELHTGSCKPFQSEGEKGNTLLLLLSDSTLFPFISFRAQSKVAHLTSATNASSKGDIIPMTFFFQGYCHKDLGNCMSNKPSRNKQTKKAQTKQVLYSSMQKHGGQFLCMPSGRQRAGAGIFHLILPGCFWGTFGSLCQTPCSAQHCAEIKTQPALCVVLVAHTGAVCLWMLRQSRQQSCAEPLAALQDGWHHFCPMTHLSTPWLPSLGCLQTQWACRFAFGNMATSELGSRAEGLSNHLTCPQTVNTQGRFCQMLNILCFSTHPLSWGSSLLKACSSWSTYSMGPVCSVPLTEKHIGLACCIAARKSLAWCLLTAGLGQYHCSIGCRAAVWTGLFDQTPYL